LPMNSAGSIEARARRPVTRRNITGYASAHFGVELPQQAMAVRGLQTAAGQGRAVATNVAKPTVVAPAAQWTTRAPLERGNCRKTISAWCRREWSAGG
jgi:hypothetical protein